MIELYRLVRIAAGLLLVMSLGACGGSDSSDGVESADTESAPGEVVTANLREGAEPITLSAADFDGFEKGIARETQLVRAASGRSANAVTSQERGEAIQAGFENNTIVAAAPVTGLSVERYKLVRETLSTLLTTLDFQGQIDGPQSVDTSGADTATRARLASDPYSALDSVSAAELKSRMSRIVPLWIAYVNLTALND